MRYFFRRAGIIIEPFTVEQAHIARQSFLDFGKGRHAAGLNFGDCFSYALAKVVGEPLLFKGEDSKKRTLIRTLMEVCRYLRTARPKAHVLLCPTTDRQL